MFATTHSRRPLRAIAVIFLLVASYRDAIAQTPAAPRAPDATVARADGATKRALSIDDYARWRSIEGAQLSSDGKWVSFVYRHTNVLPGDSKPELHILNLGTSQDVTVANASNATFSPDSRWITYVVDSVPTRGGRGAGRGGAGTADSTAVPGAGGRGGGPTSASPARTELRELATGKLQSWQQMTSATFAPTSTHLVLRRRAPAGGGGGGRGAGGPGGGGGGGGAPAGGGAAPAGSRGSEVVLHDLATGRSTPIGSVSEITFNRKGDLLAYSVDAQVRDGNGLFIIDLASGRTDAIDNDAKIYNRLNWSDDGNAIAILKGREVDKMRERDNALVVIRDVRAAVKDPALKPVQLDPATAAGFPKGYVVSDRGALTWSEDGKRVFFSIAPQQPTDSARRRSTDSVPDVDIWRTQDQRVQSQQMIQADADRNIAYRESFDVAAGKYVHLADSTMRDIAFSVDGSWAVGRDPRAYISDYKQSAADIYRVNTSTGERTLMLKGQYTGQHIQGISPDGKTFLYWKDAKFQAYDLDAGTTRTLGGANAPNFTDTEFDHPGPRPSFGFENYTADGKSAIVESRYDLWALPLDGGPARNLTNGAGAKSEIHYQIVRTEPADENAATRLGRSGAFVDLAKPVTLATYGEYTKKAGFAKLDGGQITDIVYDDAAYSTPVRARKGETYLFTRQTFAEFPDLRVSPADFKNAKKITDANPQQSEFLWGHRVLFDYKNKKGVRLQGILAIPDDYKTGEKRPMIVSFYEKNSQNMNRYSGPSFVTGMGSLPMEAVTKGYLTMFADVYFNTGSSHSDMLECVEAATKKVIEMGYADPAHIGINGHSYGGEGAAFIGTRSRMFAAVGVGAGVTDLFTDFSQSWGWSYQVTGGSGMNGNEYYLYGQGRWGASPWEKPDLFHFESALTHVPETTAPILIMHGTADPTVSFSEGMNFYNALRYNGKNAILLAYPGEGHGLRGLANRRDLTVRYFQFFDHYLKGTPAAKWMTDEQPFIKKDMSKGDPR